MTITIQGANDAPLAISDSETAVEAGGSSNGSTGINPSGNVLSNDTDVDAGDTQTVTGVVAGSSFNASGNIGTGVSGSYGSITINANGSYNYVVDNSNSAVQALRTSGNTLQDVFTYTMSDAGGLTSTTQITITIQGANDAPVLNAIPRMRRKQVVIAMQRRVTTRPAMYCRMTPTSMLAIRYL